MTFEQARDGDLTPLVETVRRWWFEADAWCDPEGQRASRSKAAKAQNRHTSGSAR
jgi:hypothetical protein